MWITGIAVDGTPYVLNLDQVACAVRDVTPDRTHVTTTCGGVLILPVPIEKFDDLLTSMRRIVARW